MDRRPLWIYSKKPRKGIFDNDFYFFEDGTILHIFDKTQNKLNCEEPFNIEDFSEQEIEEIKSSAPEEVLIIFFQ